jgi:hypothetical protein
MLGFGQANRKNPSKPEDGLMMDNISKTPSLDGTLLEGFQFVWRCGLACHHLLYWYLLPRNGQENQLVKNSDVGSMVTIALTFGAALLLNGLFG